MSRQTRGVRLPDLAPPQRGTQLVEVRDLYRVAKAVLDRTLYDGDLDEILRKTPVYEGETIVDMQLAHELRLKRVAVSESGTVGKQTFKQLVATVQVQIEHARQELVDEQPGCAWRLVAAIVEQVNVATTERVMRTAVPGGVPKASAVLQDLTGDEEYVPPTAMNQRTEHVATQVHKCMIYMVWADIGQGALVDPAAAHADTEAGRSGPMARYRSSRMLHHLSNSAQNNREKCEDIVREFQETARDTGAVSAVVDEPDIPAGPIAEDAVTSRIRELAGQGHAAGRIARQLGVPQSTVVEQLRALGLQAPARKSTSKEKPHG